MRQGPRGEYGSRPKPNQTIEDAIERVRQTVADMTWVKRVGILEINHEKKIFIDTHNKDPGAPFRGQQMARIENAAAPFSVYYFDPITRSSPRPPPR